MQKKEQLYEGKAKKVFATDDPNLYIVDYKDDATAFNGQKKGQIAGKGVINNVMSNHMFQLLEQQGVPTHFVEQLSERETVVKKVSIVPLEVIIRNISAGSFAKRYGVEEGIVFKAPTIEFSYKNDDLGDPLINDYHALALGLATEDEIGEIKAMAFKVNEVMKDYFEVPISIAVSLPGSGVGEIQDLLYQAMSAMNLTFYDNSGGAVFYSAMCEDNLSHSSNFNINFLKKDVTEAIRQNDCEAFKTIMNQMIQLFSECRPSRQQAVNACNNLYYFITSLIEDWGEQDFPYAVDIVGQLNRMANLSTVLTWLEGFRDQVVRVLEDHQEARRDRLVELALEYVKEHYQEKITLSQAAAALNVSQGHLSSTFKKQMGKNFSDYVTEMKIEKARELIESYQYMMYEISDMLGFDTQYYFSAVFKKITGYTPKEYENLVVKKPLL